MLALLVGYGVLAFWAALAGVLAYCWLEHEVQRGLAWLQGRYADVASSRRIRPGVTGNP